MVLYIQKEESNTLKGIAIIMVIMHHYFYDATDLLPIWVFNGVGAMACSFFFFLSAYGLSVSDKANCGSSYWLSRIKKLFVPMVIANTLLVVYYFCYRNYTLSYYTITDILGITSLNHPIWFLQVLILMYVALWISNTFKLNHIICCTIVGILYTLVTRGLGSISWISFSLGLLLYKKDISEKFLYAVAIMWVPSYVFYVYNGCRLNSVLLISNFAFSIVAVLACVGTISNMLKSAPPIGSYMLKKILNGLEYIGKNSIYPYLLHVTVIYFIADWLGLNNWYSFFAFVIILIVYTIVFSSFMAILNNKCFHK